MVVRVLKCCRRLGRLHLGRSHDGGSGRKNDAVLAAAPPMGSRLPKKGFFLQHPLEWLMMCRVLDACRVWKVIIEWVGSCTPDGLGILLSLVGFCQLVEHGFVARVIDVDELPARRAVP